MRTAAVVGSTVTTGAQQQYNVMIDTDRRRLTDGVDPVPNPAQGDKMISQDVPSR